MSKLVKLARECHNAVPPKSKCGSKWLISSVLVLIFGKEISVSSLYWVIILFSKKSIKYFPTHTCQSKLCKIEFDFFFLSLDRSTAAMTATPRAHQ
jgi:hypothetical protein